MTDEEKQALYALPQAERNKTVRRWAEAAGWITEDIVGDDGVTYRSFMPKS